jgi:type IV pilus assembly protein PilY1
VRSVLLGDIINSPLALASPTDKTASDLSGDSTYSTYLATKAANMNTSLVVNANDGFVNVINSANGTRRYAYMPSSVLPSLRLYRRYQTTSTASATSFWWTGSWACSMPSSTVPGKPWRLAGPGLAGEPSTALQLFDASAGNVTKALWEISAPPRPTTANAFNDLGYAYARPEVARLADGRWAAFISNGYGSNSGVAALYVVDVRDGSLIRKIVIDSTETTTGCRR